MAGVVIDFDFRKTEEELVVEGVKTRKSPPLLRNISAEALIMVAGAEVNGCVRDSLANTGKKRVSLVDFVLETVEPFACCVPPADLMKVREITEVDYTVWFDRTYEFENRVYKFCIDVRFVRVGDEDNALFVPVGGSN